MKLSSHPIIKQSESYAKIPLSSQLQEISKNIGYDAFIGKTMSVDDFYEGQGRLDGAFCDYEEQDKLEFLKKAQEKGVINIEMESLYFGSFT